MLCTPSSTLPRRAGEDLFNVGDVPDAFYIVKAGVVAAVIRPEPVTAMDGKPAPKPVDRCRAVLGLLALLGTGGEGGGPGGLHVWGGREQRCRGGKAQALGRRAGTCALNGRKALLLPPRSFGRPFTHEPGAMVGELEFFGDRQRTFSAHAMGPAVVWALPRTTLLRLRAESPDTVVLLQEIALRAIALSASHAYEVLDKVA